MEKEQIAEIFAKLSAPFEPKWRVQSSIAGGKCIVVPYLDARQVQQRLDDVLLPQNWANTYEAETGTASISINIDGEWICKSDIGTDTQVEKEKGKASDAFKRAAVLWGIGRDIYKIGSKVIPHDATKKRAMTDKGVILWTPEQLSAYMNGINTNIGLLFQIWANNAQLQGDDAFKELVNKLKEFLK